jgi:diketogulonate reductase-like aldo/keto reductase
MVSGWISASPRCLSPYPSRSLRTGNEEEVGHGIKASGVPREKIFLVSKLWCTDHRRPEQAVDVTLKALGTDYLDLYLMQ